MGFYCWTLCSKRANPQDQLCFSFPRGKALFNLGQKGITKMEAESQTNPNLNQGTLLEGSVRVISQGEDSSN